MKEGLNLHSIYAREMVDYEFEKQINTHTAEWNTPVTAPKTSCLTKLESDEDIIFVALANAELGTW